MTTTLLLAAAFMRLVALLLGLVENSLVYVVIFVVSIPLYWREMRRSSRRLDH